MLLGTQKGTRKGVSIQVLHALGQGNGHGEEGAGTSTGS